jgi:esterase/lipase
VILPEHNFTTEDLNKTIDLGYENSLLINNRFLSDLENTSLEKAQTTNNFIYILQGKRDEVVNPSDNDRFFNKYYPNNHKFIYFENANHRFKNPGELEKIISDTLSILNNEE